MTDGLMTLFGQQASTLMQAIVVWNLLLAILLGLLLACRYLLYRLNASAVVIHRLWLSVPAFILITVIALLWPQAPEPVSISQGAVWGITRLPGMLITAESSDSPGLYPWAFLCWLPVSLFLGYRLILMYRQMLSRLKLDPLCRTQPWVSSAISSAVCIGIMRPKIVISDQFESRFTAQQRHHLMCHESVHQQRLDPAWRLFSEIIRAVCWFNPLVHIAAARFYRDQEISCDERVLHNRPASERIAYARLLSQLITEHNNPPLVCTSGSTVKERIMRIAHLDKYTPGRRLSLLGLLMLMSTVAIGAELATRLPVAALSAQSPADSGQIERELADKEASLISAREQELELERVNETLRAEEARLAAEVERLQLKQEELDRKQRELEQNREELEQRHQDMQREQQERAALAYQEAQQVRQQSQELAQEARQQQQQAQQEAREATRAREEAEQLREKAAALQASQTPFEIVSRTPPKYPRTAAIERIEGFVELEFDLMPDGEIVNIRILESVPDNVFDKVAIDAVSQWQLVNNSDTFITLSERLEFQLDE